MYVGSRGNKKKKKKKKKQAGRVFRRIITRTKKNIIKIKRLEWMLHRTMNHISPPPPSPQKKKKVCHFWATQRGGRGVYFFLVAPLISHCVRFVACR